jgi:hypothetical protein
MPDMISPLVTHHRGVPPGAQDRFRRSQHNTEMPMKLLRTLVSERCFEQPASAKASMMQDVCCAAEHM